MADIFDDSAPAVGPEVSARRASPRASPLKFRRIVVIGGGCYGSWYTQQLERAATRGALMADEIVVVDHDIDCRVARELQRGALSVAPVRLEVSTWAAYVANWLAADPASLAHDAMVPSPLMPHLCLDWLVGRAQTRWPARTVQVEPLRVSPDVPWQRAAPDARHYVSFATWMCPVNCIEPAKCPETRGPRSWSLPPTLHAFAAQQSDFLHKSLIFHCTHRMYGVGMIDAQQIAAADAELAAWGNEFPFRVLVGTVSHCHGALGVLSIT